ncbi:MAG TPA: CPBP family intramembrane glutamic endopeptidase [Chryseosolibacter sp.]|nr:CPBP family intramembrane glutamic endopeptidase [Chryseosolibacter sp.]
MTTIVINELLSAILQILLFTFIPFVIFVIRHRRIKGFFDYIGLTKSTRKANFLALLVMVLLVAPLLILILTNNGFKEIMTNPHSVTGKIKQLGVGVEAISLILIASLLKTSLSEEIFFRGFIAKRLIAITSFQTGNIIQAVIFGVIHTLLFSRLTDNTIFLTVICVFPTVGAYLKCYLNERLANGSIIPGWIAHGSANLIAYSCTVFLL